MGLCWCWMVLNCATTFGAVSWAVLCLPEGVDDCWQVPGGSRVSQKWGTAMVDLNGSVQEWMFITPPQQPRLYLSF